MDTKKIREIAGILKEFGLTRIEVRDDDEKTLISLEKLSMNYMPVGGTYFDDNTGKQPDGDTRVSAIEGEVTIVASSADDSSTAIKSPIVGVFFSSPSPDNPPFVSIGSHVKKGDVVCIIEAMKLMNEVVAEQDGEIVDVCIKNGEIAEYGQVLFKIKT